MKRKVSKLIVVAVVSMMSVIITGCTSAAVDPDGPKARVELTPAQGIVFGTLDVDQEGESTIISGKIRRSFNNCCDAERGHIDLALVAPDDSVLDVVSVYYTPRDMPRVRSRASRFTADLGYILPDDMTVRVTYHERSKAANTASYTCEHI
ncbi:MAG: hypothetical protein ACYSUT_10675 [Planctomycetota bacterium]|jgi:hypothetical protein